MVQVDQHILLLEAEELALGLEIAQFQREINAYGESSGFDRLTFRRAEIEIQLTIIIGEAWQTI